MAIQEAARILAQEAENLGMKYIHIKYKGTQVRRKIGFVSKGLKSSSLKTLSYYYAYAFPHGGARAKEKKTVNFFNNSMRRIQKLEESIIAHNLIEKFTYKGINDMPKLEKITVSTSLKGQGFQFKYLPSHLVGLSVITGGKPRFTVARKIKCPSKSKRGYGFRNKRYLEKLLKLSFLDKLVNIVFPKIRDFDGFFVPYKIEGKSISIILKDPMVFPELNEEFEAFGQ